MPKRKGLKGLREERLVLGAACVATVCMAMGLLLHSRALASALAIIAYASASPLRCLSLCSFSWPLC